MDFIKVESGLVSGNVPILFDFNSGTEHFNLSTATTGLANIPVYSYVDDRGFLDTGNSYVYNNALVFKLTHDQVSVDDILVQFAPANTSNTDRYAFNVSSMLSDGFNVSFNKYVNGVKSDSLCQDGGSMGNLWDAEKYKGVLYAVRLNDTDHDLTGIAFLYHRYDMDRGSYGGLDTASYTFVLQRLKNDNKQYFLISDTDYDPEKYGPESKPGGYGDPDPLNPTGGNPALDHTSDTITIPTKPTVGVTTAGFYHAYKVTQGLLNNFGAKLFPSIGSIVGDIAGVTDVKDVLMQMATLLFSPGLYQGVHITGQNIAVIDMIINGKAIDYVVDCHVIPVSPTTGGSQNIKCGAVEIDISAPVVTDDYIDFDCGSVSIPLQYQNFLDFTQVKARLFLPFVGFVDLKPEFWHGGTINVSYRFNIVDGSFMAFVRSTSVCSNLASSLVAQYGGVSCLHIPVTGVNYSSMIAGLVTGSMNLVSGIGSGNLAGSAGSALSIANMKPEMAQSNNYNCSTSFLGCRRPYLLIERALPCMSERYPHDNGFPLNVYANIGSVTGYTEIEDFDASGIASTDDERNEIIDLLRGGVYL